MNKKATTWIAVAAGAVAVGALAIATPAIAGAASGVAGSVRAATATPTDDQAGRGGGGQGETPLTGETKDKVEEAALAKVPGATVIRVETDADGTYEAHLRKSDGTEVEVKVDKNFTVTAVNEFTGRGGKGGPRGNETPLTGDAKSKAEAAALAKVPGGTVIRSETDDDGTYEVHVRKTDGTEVEVKLDKNFAVTAVEERTGRGPGGRGNETPLTGDAKTKAEAAALAKVPGGTVVRSETDDDGTYEVHVRKSDGTEVVVKLDKSFAVTGVDEFTGRGPGRHGKGPGGDQDGQSGTEGQGGAASPSTTTQGSSFSA